jgi:drug/metabolite transporter (DMT)-like permease
MLAVFTAGSVGMAQADLRRHQRLQRISIIMISGYLMALFAIPFADLSPEASSLTVLAIMGLIQKPLAMVLFATATCFISAAEASMFMIVETIFGPLLVFIFLGEVVPLNTIYGGSIIIGALTINTWLSSKATETCQGK